MHPLTQLIIFQPLYNFLAVLTIFFRGNVGWAVLTLVIILRLFIWPWYRKAMQDQRKLALLQPELKKIQKKFKTNSLEANKAIMELLQKEKVNPFNSFLFTFVQIAIFVLLYVFFTQAVKTDWHTFLYPFVSHLPPLNYIFLSFNLQQPSFILTLLSAILNSVTTFVQPSTGQNKLLLLSLPFMILLFYQKFPAIVVLYWIGNSLVGIVQELFISREIKKIPSNHESSRS